MTNPLLSDDPEVWNGLVTAVNPASILVVIARRMGERLQLSTTAEDILQEALLRAWRSRRDFEWAGIASFRRWLIRIAERCVEDQRDLAQAKKRDAARTTAMSSDGPSSHGGGLEPWTSTTPSRLADAREVARSMEASLEMVPDDLREVVRLRLFEDLQIDEIAARLGLGESGVRHRFRRGAEAYRRSLHARLGRASAFPDGGQSAAE